MRDELYSINAMIRAAASLEPRPGSEYHRGVCELIGRLRFDYGGQGEGTAENAAEIATAIAEEP